VPLYMRVAAISDVGRVRKNNEDSGYAGEHLVVIADGVGGAAAGELASTVAVQTIRRVDTAPESDLLEILAGAVHRANDRLGELIEDDPAVEGMGTTLTAALFDGEQIGLAHIGDSRCYLYRDGQLRQLTTDHTWVQSMVDEGEITAEEARTHAHRNVILKVLQGRTTDEPDLSMHPVQEGDRLLLCSDGLSDYVEPERIERIMGLTTVEQIAGELVQLALDAGAPDNVSVVVAEIIADKPASVVPVTIGVAADQKGPLSRLRSRATRLKDTGEIPVVDAELADEARRYAPRPPRRFRWARRIAYVFAALIVLTAASGVAYGWTQRQYFVASSHGNVAIYKGIQAHVPGLSLSHVYERRSLQLSQLSTYRRDQVHDGLPAESLGDARNIVDNLQSFADKCAEIASRPTKATPTKTKTTTPKHTKQTKTTRKPHSAKRTTARTNRTTKTKNTATRNTAPTSTPTSNVPDTGATAAPGNDDSSECDGATPLTQSTGPATSTETTPPDQTDNGQSSQTTPSTGSTSP
jgi:PPM family protein phosphatase